LVLDEDDTARRRREDRRGDRDVAPILLEHSPRLPPESAKLLAATATQQ
jgi:hypothetical protein